MKKALQLESISNGYLPRANPLLSVALAAQKQKNRPSLPQSNWLQRVKYTRYVQVFGSLVPGQGNMRARVWRA
jgi:hypothetical protein